jgi:hypothetical protein
MKICNIINEVSQIPNVNKAMNAMDELELSLRGWNKNVQIQDEVNNLIDAIYKLKERLGVKH